MWGYSVFGLGIVFQESVDGRAAFVGARPPCRRLETYLLVHVMLISELCTGWNADPWGAAAGFPRLDAYPMGMNLVQHLPNAFGRFKSPTPVTCMKTKTTVYRSCLSALTPESNPGTPMFGQGQ